MRKSKLERWCGDTAGPYRAIAIAFVALGSIGCQARVLVPSDGDAAREQIRTLKTRVAQLEAANAELTVNLAAARSAAMTAEGSPPAPDAAQAAVLAETPRAVRMSIVSGSSFERDAADPSRGSLTLYLETVDSRGRFVQVAGTLEVAVVSLPTANQGEPVRLGDLALGPKELRDSWRSGFFGTHYTVTVPVDFSRVNGATAVAISVNLRDGPEGRRLVASTTMNVADSTTREFASP